MLQYSLLEGLKVVLIELIKNFCCIQKVFLALWWDIFYDFMRIHEDYVRKDLGVLGLTKVVEFSVAWKLLTSVGRDRQIIFWKQSTRN